MTDAKPRRIFRGEVLAQALASATRTGNHPARGRAAPDSLDPSQSLYKFAGVSSPGWLANGVRSMSLIRSDVDRLAGFGASGANQVNIEILQAAPRATLRRRAG